MSDEALALIKPKQAVPSSVDEPSQRVIDTIADGLTKTQIATPVANDEPPAVPTLEKPEKRDEQCDLLEELRQRPFAELQQMREQLTEPQRDLLRYLLE